MERVDKPGARPSQIYLYWEGGRLQQDLDIRSYNGSSYWDSNRRGAGNQAVAKGPVLQLPLDVLDPGGKNG